jgi:site-specific DNA-adenine methylase
MFSYAGRKWKAINKYPLPIMDTIVEPFAGSASFAYRYWDHQVVLYDTYEVICRIWWYLQQAKAKDILALPIPKNGEPVVTSKTEWMCQEERWLLGFSCNNASATPKNFAGRMNSWERDRLRIAADLHKIRHWKIINAPYYQADITQPSTWFVDPPYQKNKGVGYAKGKELIDYEYLGRWCRHLKGQIIVCEGEPADWLPFKPFISISGQRKPSLELLWYKETR